MSLNSALLTGDSSLVANSAALAAISDNISNVNTVGYKQNSTQFEDLVAAQATQGNYNSGGVQADVTQLIAQQGQFQATTTSTNMAINGKGFFVVSSTNAGLTPTSGPSFTRAGAFSVNADGYLVNTAGQFLQGWTANAAGVIATNPSNLSALSTINVDNIPAAPDPTTTASVSANLNADLYAPGQASAAVTGGTYSAASTTTSMAAYDQSGGTTGTAPDYSTDVTIYDGQGGPHNVQLDFLKSTTANTWNVEVNAVPDTSVTPTNGQLAAGTVTFSSTGALTSMTLTPTGGAAVTSTTGQASIPIPFTAASGLGTQTVSLSLGGTNGGLTQYASASTTTANTVNGGPASPVAGISISTQGFVQATFQNGTTKNVAQVALATFNDADGLAASSGNAYTQTAASGNFTLGAPTSGNAGAIEASQLESSTVDLSTEFTNLITTQNAYSAASKIISTADRMYQTLGQLIP